MNYFCPSISEEKHVPKEEVTLSKLHRSVLTGPMYATVFASCPNLLWKFRDKKNIAYTCNNALHSGNISL